MANQLRIQPTRPQGIGVVLDTAFQLYKASLPVVWPISLLLTIVGLPSTLYWMLGDQALPARGGLGVRFGFGFDALDPLGSSIGLISSLLSLWVMGALCLKQRAVGVDESLGLGAALKMALRRLPVLFAATILVVLAVAAGVLLLVVPGLILSVSLAMYMVLLLFENRGALDSVTGSHRLVWGNWWRSSVIFAVALVLIMVIFVAVGVVAGIVTPFVGSASEDIVIVSELVGTTVFNVLLMPFITAVMIALYWDLKLRKEGADLAARVNALNTA